VRRFYKTAAARPVDGGHEVLLDERPVKTPGRERLVLPSAQLGQAVVDEWNAQGESIDPRSMPLTGLANAAIDRIMPDREAFGRGLALYGESDLLCYRAEQPRGLVARQSELWDPILAWARHRFDVDFEVVTGIMHRPQAPTTLAQLARAVAARDRSSLPRFLPWSRSAAR
jgi:chaperone required for assembly of F1-ATPase